MKIGLNQKQKELLKLKKELQENFKKELENQLLYQKKIKYNTINKKLLMKNK